MSGIFVNIPLIIVASVAVISVDVSDVSPQQLNRLHWRESVDDQVAGIQVDTNTSIGERRDQLRHLFAAFAACFHRQPCTSSLAILPQIGKCLY